MSTLEHYLTKTRSDGSTDKTAGLNKSFETEIRQAITEPGSDSNDFIMELEEYDWNNERQRRLTLTVPSPTKLVSNNSVSEEKKSETAPTRTISEQEEDIVEDYYIKQKPLSPLIRTVTPRIPSVEGGKCSLRTWTDFQDLLKGNLRVISTESEYKERLVKEIKEDIAEQFTKQLSIREKNDIMHKKRHPEHHPDDDLTKIFSVDQSQRLGNASPYVKELLYLIYENPKIIALASKSSENVAALKVLEDTFALSFFENILDDEEADCDLLRFYAAALQVELKYAQKHRDLLSPHLFFNRMWAAYLKRNECQAYMKSMLGDPLLGCIKERTKIKLDINEVKKDVERKRLKAQKTMILNKSERQSEAPKIERAQTKDIESNFSQATLEGLRDFAKNQNDIEPIIIPKFKENGTKPAPPIENDTLEEKKTSLKKAFDSTYDHLYVSPLKSIADKEVAQNLERNFNILKKHLSVLIQSIFDNLKNMPMRLRVLCKITHYLTKKKFPNLSEKESYEILLNNLFRSWIFPKSVDTSILDYFEPSADLAHNLVEIPKSLKKVFDLELYPLNDNRSELNEYFKEIIPSIQKYLKELISVDEEVLHEVLQTKPPQIIKTKSKSICLSLSEIKLICECITRYKHGLIDQYPTAVSLAEKILGYEQSENIFSFGINSQTGQAVKSSQLFLLFHDIVFPSHLNPNYLEEFNKVPDIPKQLPDQEKVILKAKYCLKNFLIGTKSLRNTFKWNPSTNMTLDVALEQFFDKTFCEDIAQAQRTDKTPTHLSARFLHSLLAQLPDAYKSGNYYKLYQEMIEDFGNKAENLDMNISSIKLQLLEGKEVLKARNDHLTGVEKERAKALKRDGIWEFIKSLKIPMCITSPSTMGSILKDAYKNNANKSKLLSDNIEVHLRANKGCIHDQFSIMRELTISAGAIAIGSIKPKTSSKSMITTSSSTNGASAFDDTVCHVETVDKFISFFGSLREVKQAIMDGKDDCGVNNGVGFLYNQIKEEIQNKYKSSSDEEIAEMMEEVENYICKKLYYYAFPTKETEADRVLYKKCKLLEWVTFEHLEVIPRNRHEELWRYNAETLNQIDNKITPAEKLQCMQGCLRIITDVADLASSKEGSAGTEEVLPILVYTILKACPKRMHSNLNFIELFRDPKRMLGLDGFCFIQTKSAMLAVQNADHTFFKIESEKFTELVKAKETEYGYIMPKSF